MKRTCLYLCGALFALALSAVSCSRETVGPDPADGMLRAHIVQAESRTSFDGNTGKFHWTKGDRIAIHMTDGTYHEAEVAYRTGAFDSPSTKSVTRNFYAISPASIAVPAAYGDPDLDIVLPASYDISARLSSDEAPLPMIALNIEEESDLYFNHAGGLIRIICDDVPVGAARIRVSFARNVTGTFRVGWKSAQAPFIADGGDGNTVLFSIAETALEDVMDGIRVNVPVPTGHYGLVTVEVLGATDSEVLSTVATDMDWNCERGHGKLFGLDVNSYTFTCLGDIVLPSYPAGSSDATSLTSYKVIHRTGESLPVAWGVDGYFADATCETPYDGSDAANAPDWLTSLGDAGFGPGSTEPAAVPVVYKAMAQQLLSETYPAAAQAINAQIESSTFGAGSSPLSYYNLSNPANMTSDVIVETANSYIVNGTGYFRIPLVLGCGIVDGLINPDVRTYQGMSGVADVIEFCDYKGRVPANPFLHKTSVDAGTPTTAFVVWEDEARLIEVANDDDYTLPGSPLVRKNDTWWLCFHVARPVQGNAVIAVADENGDVMWSWHIWVTDFVPRNYGGHGEIELTEHAGNTYEIFPKPLGYVVSGLTRSWSSEADEVYVRLRQEESFQTCVLHYTRPAGTRAEERPARYAPYFQWGRKDAIHPGKHLWYGRYPMPVETYDPYYSLLAGIQNPQGPITKVENRWVQGGQYNRWSAANTVTTVNNDPVIKTVNDPCPPGYSMPPSAVFTGFTTSGIDSAIANSCLVDVNGDGQLTADDVEDGGAYFYTNANQTATIFIPMLNLYGDYFQGSVSGGAYWTAGPAANTTARTLIFFYNGQVRVAADGSMGFNIPVLPVVARRPVFGGEDEANATTSGAQVEEYDMGSLTWE